MNSKCETCQLYGVVDGGDIVPYGSTTTRLPEVCGCTEEWDTDEDGNEIDTVDCSHYQELPRCKKHSGEYLDLRAGCSQCEHEYYEEEARRRREREEV